MKTDALNRRMRFSAPQPFEPFNVSESDQDEILRPLDTHGHLPTPLLFQFTSRKNYTRFQERLTRLYNGYCSHRFHAEDPEEKEHRCTRHLVSYLRRDPQQFHNMNARYEPLVYSLNENARRLLQQGGKAARSFKRSSSFVHDLYSSCFTASVELAAHRFVSRDEIIKHPNCPATTRDAATPFQFELSGEKLIPDDLFGIEYETGGFRFFALEVDRATERIDTRNPLPSSIMKKVAAYQRVLDNKLYRDVFGLPTLSVIFATVNDEHMRTMIEHVRKNVAPVHHSKFLFASYDNFGELWRVPREPLKVFMPYESAAGRIDISKRASQ